MPSLYIETFGCQMNEADSRYIAERAAAAGYSVASVPEEADVVVINTCTVRDTAQQRAYGRMNHLKALKVRDPRVRLVVTGCLAEQDRDVMRRRAPHVDAVFGTRELARLGDQLAAWQPGIREAAPAGLFSDDPRESMNTFALGGSVAAATGAFSHLRAFVTVQRGCSYYCTFCIVPHVRGRFDHRRRGEILADVRERIAAGAREIMLVGQTVNAWRDPADGADFGELCSAVANLPGLERLTFISPHPKDFNERIVERLAGVPQLNPRIHLPLQSASDAVLRRMNRKYTLAQFAGVVDSIRGRMPAAAITTDIIVGFPGESEDDFERTLAYVNTGVFANAFMFVYSIRHGTPAARWEQVPRDVALARFKRLLDAQNRVTREYHDAMVGRVVRALIVGESKKDPSRLAAKTPENVTLVVPKPDDFAAAPNGAPHPYARRPWLDVAIAGAHVWGCDGSIVGRSERFAS
jgi:tRNA-2-methylthio-N6-dimethylallyladenosine synthase